MYRKLVTSIITSDNLHNLTNNNKSHHDHSMKMCIRNYYIIWICEKNWNLPGRSNSLISSSVSINPALTITTNLQLRILCICVCTGRRWRYSKQEPNTHHKYRDARHFFLELCGLRYFFRRRTRPTFKISSTLFLNILLSFTTKLSIMKTHPIQSQKTKI